MNRSIKRNCCSSTGRAGAPLGQSVITDENGPVIVLGEEKCLESGDRGGIHRLPVRANLLEGREFERSGRGRRRGFAWAIEDVFTMANLVIAMTAALAGHAGFELLRKRF